MAHREFVDSHGVRWDVWSVSPEFGERRRQAADPEKRITERRARAAIRVPLGDAWANGWLCFESQGEKRRLAPVPDGWSEMSPESLERLCASATPSRGRQRRLIE
jgi:hypothetical protein